MAGTPYNLLMLLAPILSRPLPYNNQAQQQQALSMYQGITQYDLAAQQNRLARLHQMAHHQVVLFNFPIPARLPRWGVRSSVTGIQLITPGQDEVRRGYQGFRKLYPVYPTRSFQYSVITPIHPDHQKTGTIYIFSRPDDPQYINIGMITKLSIAELATKIETVCKFTPIFHFTITDVPTVGRVLNLIHTELEHLTLRRIEPVCKHGGLDANGSHDSRDETLCRGFHKNWFEMSVDGYGGASDTVQEWVRFMRNAKPYNDDGTIKEAWAAKIRLIPLNRCVLTVNVLFAMESEMRVSRAVTLELVERQAWWTGLMTEAMWAYRDYGRLKRVNRGLSELMACLATGVPFPVSNIDIDAAPIIDLEDLATTTDGGEGMSDDCLVIWKHIGPCEKVCFGCANPGHLNKMCAWRVVVKFVPLADEWTPGN